MARDLCEAWSMNNEANLFLLGEIEEEALADRYSGRTRTVADQFAHMHDVRVRWLTHAAPDFLGKGKVPSWKGSAATFLCYLVADEAHHRGLAMVAMKAGGRKLPPEVVYGLWQWGKKRNMR